MNSIQQFRIRPSKILNNRHPIISYIVNVDMWKLYKYPRVYYSDYNASNVIFYTNHKFDDKKYCASYRRNLKIPVHKFILKWRCGSLLLIPYQNQVRKYISN